MTSFASNDDGAGLAAPQRAALASFHAVIPAGGVGTRLWPLSRAGAPKFLHDLTGSGSTLLRATYDRLEPLAHDRMMVVTGVAHAGSGFGAFSTCTRHMRQLAAIDSFL